MKSLIKNALCTAVAFGACASYAAQELVVWEDNGKADGIAAAVKDFESTCNCKITVQQSSSVEHLNEYKKLKEQGGRLPDVFIIISDRVGEAVEADAIAPLSFMQADRAKYAEASISPFALKNEIYAMPRSIESLVVYYNKDVMDYPFETFDDYVKFARERKSQGGYGLIGKLDNFYFGYGFIGGMGGYVFGRNADGSFNAKDVGINNTGAVSGVEIIKDYALNYLPPVLLTDEGWGEIDKMFISGKAAAVITGPWSLEGYSKAGVNYGLAPLPKLPNGRYMRPFYGVKGYAISKDSKEHSLAERFLAHINQPKYALIRYSKIAELPPVLSVMDDPLIVNDDFANAIAHQIMDADAMPSIPEMGRVWGAMGDALNAVIKNNANIKEALDKAADVVLGKDEKPAEPQTPAQEESAPEQEATAEEAPAQEAPAEEAPAEEAPAEEAPAEEAPAEEAPAEEAPAEEAPAEQAPAEETPAAE